MSEQTLVIDFESRSQVSLETAGAINYAQDPSTSIFCVGYKLNSGPCQLWIPERGPMPEDFWRGIQNAKLCAHNASFERAITRWLLPRYPLITAQQRAVLVSLPASRWRCTAAKAAACSLPRSLEGAAQALKLKTQKDMAGNKILKKYHKPRKPTKNNPKVWWDKKRRVASHLPLLSR